MATKYALVLSGGGFKGAFELGALEYINSNWKNITGLDTPMQFDIVSGISVGSLNGLLVAQKDFAKLQQLWNKIHDEGADTIYTSAFIDNRGQISVKFDTLKKTLLPNFKIDFGMLIKAVFNKEKFKTILGDMLKSELELNLPKVQGLADNTPLKNTLMSYADTSKIPVGNIYQCGFVSLESGEYIALKHTDFADKDQLTNAVVASTAMPLAWQPVKTIVSKTGSYNYNVDGGVKNVSPLGDVIALINDDPSNDYKIIIVNCSNGKAHVQHKTWHILNVALRSLTDLAFDEIFNNDIQTFININSLVKQARDKGVTLYRPDDNGELSNKELKYFEHVVIQPVDDLGDTLHSDKPIIEMRRNHGYAIAQTVFNGGWPV